MASPSGWNPKTYSITVGGVACELRVTVECTRITTKADSIEITAFVKSALFDVSGATPVLKKSCSAYRQYRFDTNVTTGEVTYVLYTAPASATANTTIGGVSVDIFAEWLDETEGANTLQHKQRIWTARGRASVTPAGGYSSTTTKFGVTAVAGPADPP